MRKREYLEALKAIDQSLRILTIVASKGTAISPQPPTPNEVLAAILAGVTTSLAAVRTILVEIHEPVSLYEDSVPPEEGDVS